MNTQPATLDQAAKEREALAIYLGLVSSFQVETGRKQPDQPLAALTDTTDLTDFATWLRNKAEQTRAAD